MVRTGALPDLDEDRWHLHDDLALQGFGEGLDDPISVSEDEDEAASARARA